MWPYAFLNLCSPPQLLIPPVEAERFAAWNAAYNGDDDGGGGGGDDDPGTTGGGTTTGPGSGTTTGPPPARRLSGTAGDVDVGYGIAPRRLDPGEIGCDSSCTWAVFKDSSCDAECNTYGCDYDGGDCCPASDGKKSAHEFTLWKYVVGLACVLAWLWLWLRGRVAVCGCAWLRGLTIEVSGVQVWRRRLSRPLVCRVKRATVAARWPCQSHCWGCAGFPTACGPNNVWQCAWATRSVLWCPRCNPLTTMTVCVTALHAWLSACVCLISTGHRPVNDRGLCFAVHIFQCRLWC